MKPRRKRILKRLARQPRGKRDEAPRIRKDAWVAKDFAQRRAWVAGTAVIFTIATAVLGLLPTRPAYLLLVSIAALAAFIRHTFWRCPNCDTPLPVDLRFGFFTQDWHRCRKCHVRLL